jgi:hypothetical protein
LKFFPDVVTRAAGLAALTCLALANPALINPARAQPADCAREAAAIRKAETELPRLDVAPPDDKQIVCITLETNVLFAQRIAAHVAQCPRSPLSRNADSWQRTGTQYSALFDERRCKRAIKGYRG